MAPQAAPMVTPLVVWLVGCGLCVYVRVYVHGVYGYMYLILSLSFSACVYYGVYVCVCV